VAKPTVELGNVRLSLNGKDTDAQRAEHIARLMFTYLQELIEREQLHLRSDTEISHITVPPVEAPADGDDENATARACAQGVYRALVQSLVG
jgi:hypothetical protein